MFVPNKNVFPTIEERGGNGHSVRCNSLSGPGWLVAFGSRGVVGCPKGSVVGEMDIVFLPHSVIMS